MENAFNLGFICGCMFSIFCFMVFGFGLSFLIERRKTVAESEENKEKNGE